MEKDCCDVKYKLILTDLNMPNMDGFAAAEHIIEYQQERKRRDPDFRLVPVVAVTAYEDNETVNRCLKIGMSAVLHKPVSSEKLERIVQKFYFCITKSDAVQQKVE